MGYLPTERWNKFWLRTHEKLEFLTAVPNPGHYSITSLAKACNIRVMYVPDVIMFDY